MEYKAGSFWNNLAITADSFADSPINNIAPAPDPVQGPLAWILENWQLVALGAIALLIFIKD